MSFRTVAWMLLAAVAGTTVVVFNYWAGYQPLSTLAYAGIVLALAGLANLVFPFRFLGIRKRAAGALLVMGGVALTLTALFWPKTGFVDRGEHEIATFWAWNARANRRPDVHTLEEFTACREQGTVKMGLHFYVEEAGNGWTTVITEQRVAAVDEATSRGVARYWRLIVPGSGLLRIQWLEGIKIRAELLDGRSSRHDNQQRRVPSALRV